MIALNVASNWINAILSRNVSGYGHLSVTQLFLLWTTRPRFAWSIVLILPWQSDRQMYVSCVASTLATELGLQIIGAYTMIRVATHGTKLNIYATRNRLDGYPFQNDAELMYRSTLAYLILALAGFMVILWSVLGIHDRISIISQLKPRQKSRKREKRCSEAAGSVGKELNDQELSTHFPELGHVSVDTLQASWTQIAQEWKVLHTYIESHGLALRSAQRRSERLQDGYGASSDQHMRAAVAESAVTVLADHSTSTPTVRRDKASRKHDEYQDIADGVERLQDQIRYRWETSTEKYIDLSTRLAWTDCEIEYIVENIKTLHSDALRNRQPTGFDEYLNEAHIRAGLIRSTATDNAWKIERLQEDTTSDLTSNILRLHNLVQTCGLENGSDGIASEWKGTQQTAHDLDKKRIILENLKNTLDSQTEEWISLEEAWQIQIARQEKKQTVRLWFLEPARNVVLEGEQRESVRRERERRRRRRSTAHSSHRRHHSHRRTRGRNRNEDGHLHRNMSQDFGRVESVSAERVYGENAIERETQTDSQRQEHIVAIDKLLFIAFVTFFTLLICWICQWLWWVGFVRLSGDS